MSFEVLGIYREVEFSPGKVEADRAIMDAVLVQLRAMGARTTALEAPAAASPDSRLPAAQLVIAMCQGGGALRRLAALENAGAIVVNSALAIRNCYRDLLGPGLSNAGVPAPAGVVVQTADALRTPQNGVDFSRPLYVKRGDLHALADDDVRRVNGPQELRIALQDFAERGVGQAYVQQEVEGSVVKFYGVGSGVAYFSAIAPDDRPLPEEVRLALREAAGRGAQALGVEVWGGDAIIAEGGFSIIDLNDWPSFERVRDAAAAAIARRCHALLGQRRRSGDLAVANAARDA